jgi:hypothetical protein
MPAEHEKRPPLTLDQKLSIGAIAVSSLALIFTVFVYIRPSDPAHPPRFDWLDHIVSFPVWQGGLAVLGTIGITAGIARLKRQATKLILLPTSQPIAAAPKVLPPQGQPGTRPNALPKDVPRSTDRTELSIESPDDVVIHIRRYDSNMRGLVINVDNNRLDAIKSIVFTVYSAQSFDGRHEDFRKATSFNAGTLAQPNTIQPCFSSNPFLLVRYDPKYPNLLALDDNAHALIWPQNDPSEVQIWRFSIGFKAETAPPGAAASVPLTAIRRDVIVTWDRPANEFYIELATDKA